MIFLRSLLLALAMSGVLTTVAFADEVQDQVVSALSEQGFTHIEVERTWLGRLRFEATNGETAREIVINPKTGEILRDIWAQGDHRLSPAEVFRKEGPGPRLEDGPPPSDAELRERDFDNRPSPPPRDEAAGPPRSDPRPHKHDAPPPRKALAE